MPLLPFIRSSARDPGVQAGEVERTVRKDGCFLANLLLYKVYNGMYNL